MPRRPSAATSRSQFGSDHHHVPGSLNGLAPGQQSNGPGAAGREGTAQARPEMRARGGVQERTARLEAPAHLVERLPGAGTRTRDQRPCVVEVAPGQRTVHARRSHPDLTQHLLRAAVARRVVRSRQRHYPLVARGGQLGRPCSPVDGLGEQGLRRQDRSLAELPVRFVSIQAEVPGSDHPASQPGRGDRCHHRPVVREKERRRRTYGPARPGRAASRCAPGRAAGGQPRQ